MNNDVISKKQLNMWLISAMSAPLAQVAAGCTWEVVLLTGAISSIASWVLGKMSRRETTESKWLHYLQLVWTVAILSQLCRYPALIWPGEGREAVPVTLLALAAYSADRNMERPSRVGSVIYRFLFFLYGIVILSAIGKVDAANIREAQRHFDPALLVIFLIPSLLARKAYSNVGGLAENVLFGLSVSVVTIGALSQRVVDSVQSPFYELSRSISFLGVAERFESLIAAAMTMGYFTLFSLMLCSSMKTKKEVWTVAAAAALIYLGGIRINAWFQAAGSIAAWYIVPFGKAIKNYRKNEKSA